MLPNQSQRLILLEHLGASAICVVGIVFLPGVDGLLAICVGALCWFGNRRYERAKTPVVVETTPVTPFPTR